MRRLIFAVIIAVAGTQMSAAQESDYRIVPGERAGRITPDSSESGLRAIYCDERVIPREVHIGEGFYEPGALIHFDDGASAEIVWRDPSRRSGVRSVGLVGPQWRTAEGIRLGLTLKEIERINGGPFRLFGFDWDYSGTVASWNGGLLEQSMPQGSGARVVVVLLPDRERYEDLPFEDRLLVMGEGSRSSALPMMQYLNPSVSALTVRFGQ